MRFVTLICAALLAWGCASEPTRSARSSSWEHQMQSGVAAVGLGQPELAVDHCQRAGL